MPCAGDCQKACFEARSGSRLGHPVNRGKMHYPRVEIQFCTKCKWNLRAAWYLQELLQTFGDQLGEVALAPGESGTFRVSVTVAEGQNELEVWDRKKDGGFPDSKELKRRVRNIISPDQNLGHVDRHGQGDGLLVTEPQPTNECQECK